MPDIFATGDVDLKKLLNAEDCELISRIKSILGPFILRRLKSDVMQQLVPKIQHVRLFLLIGNQLCFLMFEPKFTSLQVKFVIMDTEQSKAYKGAIDEYRAACQARSAKSSVGMTNNVVGLIPKRQISNYFTQFRKVSSLSTSMMQKLRIMFMGLWLFQMFFHCSTDRESSFAYKAYLQ